MTVNLSMLAGVGAQFFSDSGVPLSGGLIYTYAAGGERFSAVCWASGPAFK